jgi:hypothetical protein
LQAAQLRNGWRAWPGDITEQPLASPLTHPSQPLRAFFVAGRGVLLASPSLFTAVGTSRHIPSPLLPDRLHSALSPLLLLSRSLLVCQMI